MCLSPSRRNFDETLSSLQFADRAKKAVVRPAPRVRLPRRLIDKILKKMLANFRQIVHKIWQTVTFYRFILLSLLNLISFAELIFFNFAKKAFSERNMHFRSEIEPISI